MRLTEHFDLWEFERSDAAVRHGIDNRVPAGLVGAVVDTARMLERIRTRLWRAVGFECPLILTSGYRSLELNRLIGSRDSSDHVQGRAADFIAPYAGTPQQVVNFLLPWVTDLGIGQLVLEYPDSPSGWVHVSTAVPRLDVNRVIAITHGEPRVQPIEGWA